MERNKLLRPIVFLMVFLFLTDALAQKFYWYYSIWWFDMLMHFLGGLWLGLVFIYFFLPKNITISLILKILAFVFLAGIGWEAFEFYFINYVAQNSFNILDTISDVLFDLIGGISAVLYFSKRIMPPEPNKVE